MRAEEVLGYLKALIAKKEYDGAGYHNSVYRGHCLGDHVTEAQKQAIKDGTFKDLFIGDYWTINGMNYRIASFDYYFNKGNTRLKKHHVVLVPDDKFYMHKFNESATTVGGYAKSLMRTEGLNQAKEIINDAFGEVVLTYRNMLWDVNIGSASWYDCTVELLSEVQLFGCFICEANVECHKNTIDTTQFQLFTYFPEKALLSSMYWLRNVCSEVNFTLLQWDGTVASNNANGAFGVRPYFLIGG